MEIATSIVMGTLILVNIRSLGFHIAALYSDEARDFRLSLCGIFFAALSLLLVFSSGSALLAGGLLASALASMLFFFLFSLHSSMGNG